MVKPVPVLQSSNKAQDSRWEIPGPTESQKPLAVIQSSNTPNPKMQPLAGKLAVRVFFFLLFFVPLSDRKLLQYVCFHATHLCLSPSVKLFGFVPLSSELRWQKYVSV